MVQTLTLLALVFGLTLMPAAQQEIVIDQIRTEDGRAFGLVATRVAEGFDLKAEIDGKMQTAMQVRRTKDADLWDVTLGGDGSRPMRIDLGILRGAGGGEGGEVAARGAVGKPGAKERAKASAKAATKGARRGSLDVTLAEGRRSFETPRGAIVLMRTPTSRYLLLPGEHSLISLR